MSFFMLSITRHIAKKKVWIHISIIIIRTTHIYHNKLNVITLLQTVDISHSHRCELITRGHELFTLSITYHSAKEKRRSCKIHISIIIRITYRSWQNNCNQLTSLWLRIDALWSSLSLFIINDVWLSTVWLTVRERERERERGCLWSIPYLL